MNFSYRLFYFALLLGLSVDAVDRQLVAEDREEAEIYPVTYLEQPTSSEAFEENSKETSVEELIEEPEEATYPVVLQPKRKTQLYAELNAPIQVIQYRMGDLFNKGDVLIELKNDKFRAKYEKAIAFLEKAEMELLATKELYEEYIASDFELSEAKASLAEAKAELLIALSDLESTVIRAPYSGRVTSLFVEEHEMPPANKQLIEIIDDHVLIAKLLFNADELKSIKIGQQITINFPSLGASIPARISRIGAMIDPSSDTIKVEAEINNGKGELTAGMVGTANIQLPDEE